MKKQRGVRGWTHKTGYISLISLPRGKPMLPPALPETGGFIDMKKFVVDPIIALEFNENRYTAMFLLISIRLSLSLSVYYTS
jgi:hypothetical protein